MASISSRSTLILTTRCESGPRSTDWLMLDLNWLMEVFDWSWLVIMEAVMSVSSSGVRFAETHADEVLKAHRSSVLRVSAALGAVHLLH